MRPPVKPVAPNSTMSKGRASLIAPSCHAEPARPRGRPTAMNVRRATTAITAITALGAAAGAGYALGDSPGGPAPGTPPIALANADLVAAGSCDGPARLLRRARARPRRSLRLGRRDGRVRRAGRAPTPPPPGRSGRGRASPTSRSVSNESGTNVQEAGVDESDVVKVAGPLLLRLRDGELLAYDVSGAEPSLLSSTRLDDARGNGWPGDPGGEMVLVDGRAVVVGTSADGLTSTLTTVDLSDPTSPTVVDTTTVSGRASAVRVHDDVVRVVLQNGLPGARLLHPGGHVRPGARPAAQPGAGARHDAGRLAADRRRRAGRRLRRRRGPRRRPDRRSAPRPCWPSTRPRPTTRTTTAVATDSDDLLLLHRPLLPRRRRAALGRLGRLHRLPVRPRPGPRHRHDTDLRLRARRHRHDVRRLRRGRGHHRRPLVDGRRRRLAARRGRPEQRDRQLQLRRHAARGRRRPGRGRPRRRPRRRRADQVGAVVRRPRDRGDLPPDRPALRRRPVRPVGAAADGPAEDPGLLASTSTPSASTA